MKSWWMGVLLGLVAWGAAADPFKEIRFPTRFPAPVFEPEGRAADLLPAFRASVAYLPEELVFVGSLRAAPELLGVPQEAGRRLATEVTNIYPRIRSHPTTAGLKSALAVGFAEQQPAFGHAFVRIPEGAGPETPVIVFIHGYGGNFLFYPYRLQEIFPEAILVHPSVGYSGFFLSRGYLTEVWATLEKEGGFRPGKPWLIGLSSGGRGALRVYCERPQAFAGLVGVSTRWADRDLAALPGDGVVRLVAGVNDSAVPESVRKALPGQVSRRVRDFRYAPVPGGHFGLLLESEAYDAALRAMVRE